MGGGQGAVVWRAAGSSVGAGGSSVGGRRE